MGLKQFEGVHRVGRVQAGARGPDQGAGSPPHLPTVRRGNHIRHQTDHYQTGGV